MSVVKLSVSTVEHKTLLLKIPAGCTYTLNATATGAAVKKVQYSLDGGCVWFTGTSFTIPNLGYSFKVRVLDGTGTWTAFNVKNGTGVTAN